jgi:hypothetical protein
VLASWNGLRQIADGITQHDADPRALKRCQSPRCSTRFLANEACSTTTVARFKIETGDEGIKMNWVYLRCDKLALWLCGAIRLLNMAQRP